MIAEPTVIPPYDYKADVWSLGITCIELAEGFPPLFELDPMIALHRVLRDPPPQLSNSSKW